MLTPTTMSYFQNTSLSPSTIQAYEPRIRKWKEIVPGQSLDYIILFPKQSIRLLSQHLKEREIAEKRAICTMTNLRNYISAILAILRHSPHVIPTLPDRHEYFLLWLGILDEASKPMKDRQKQHMPTVIQSKKGGSQLTYEQILQKRDSGGLEMYGHLLLSMYTYIYPVRADYFATEIVYDDAEPAFPNYIRIRGDHSELVLRDFKTAKRYSAIRYERLPDALHRVIVQSLQSIPRSFLFAKPDGKPYTRNTFSQWASRTLHTLFGVEMTLTLIRHQFISTLSMELPANQLEAIGRLMGHSLSVQKLYKWHSTQEKKEDGDEEADSESEEE